MTNLRSDELGRKHGLNNAFDVGSDKTRALTILGAKKIMGAKAC